MLFNILAPKCARIFYEKIRRYKQIKEIALYLRAKEESNKCFSAFALLSIVELVNGKLSLYLDY